jgi:hypothetical protein
MVLENVIFGDILTGRAVVNLIRFKDGSYAVGRHLPPGIDVAPSCYRGKNGTEAEAREMFAACCAYVERLGYPRQVQS